MIPHEQPGIQVTSNNLASRDLNNEPDFATPAVSERVKLGE